jgi:hypothetical protein
MQPKSQRKILVKRTLNLRIRIQPKSRREILVKWQPMKIRQPKNQLESLVKRTLKLQIRMLPKLLKLKGNRKSPELRANRRR